MIKHYLTAALKNLLGDKLYCGINIVGLAFGLAATILIALYVVDETSYDKHWKSADSIYRVNTSSNASGNGFVRSAATALPVVPTLRSYFPETIATSSRLMQFASEIKLDTAKFKETVTRVDSGFMDMFALEAVAGSLADALAAPGKIALRADMAQRVFGADANMGSVVGRVLNISTNGVSRDYQVAAVYRFPAGNSVLDLPMLTLLDESVLPSAYGNWGVLAVSSYVQLQAGVDVETINARLKEFTDRNANFSTTPAGAAAKASEKLQFDLQNITAIHLNSAFDTARAGGNRTTVFAFTAIAILVLLIGSINFTILSTAKATKRAKETALRKTVGASRGELIGQFLGESFCVVLPSMLLACVLVELLLPVFEAMVGKTLQIGWLSPATLLALALVYLAVSVLGGLYPALVLSRFRPAETLRGARVSETGSSRNLRNVLVIFQFGVSIALIIATSVIYTQVRFAMNRDPGFNRENLLVIDNLSSRAGVNANKEALKDQLRKLEAVSSATLSSHQPTQTLGLANMSAPYSAQGSAPESLTTLSIDYDFFGTYQTAIVAGRAFSAAEDQPAEIFARQANGPAPSKVIINVAASRRLGFASAQAAIDQQLHFTNPITRTSYDLMIVGVAADTNFYSMNAVSRAEVYSLSPGFTDVLTLRFEGDAQAMLARVRDTWRTVMGDAELSSSFVAQNMAKEFAREQVEARLLVSFSLLAIVISCLGLYGSAAFSINRRTKEIGIRKVMGAQVREIVTLLLWQFSRPVLIANAIAWPLATWAMLTWLQRFPYQINALLLLPLCVIAGAIALSIAWLTVVSNTVRVATNSPVLALRYE